MKSTVCLLLLCVIFGCEIKEKSLEQNYYPVKTAFPANDPLVSKYLLDDSRALLELKIDSLTNHQIDSLLKCLMRSDQKYREQMHEVKKRNDDGELILRELGEKMKRTDTVNFTVLKGIINRIGWPSKSVFSDSAVDASFIITLHHVGNDLEYLTPIIEESFYRNEIRNDHYAILTDRVLIRDGKSQKFGTHCRMNDDGFVDFISLPDTTGINQNRQEIGLGDLNWTTCDLLLY